MCKPKACCGEHHKHYVYNTESMEGVCVRHNNDCTAVCVPREADPGKRRICSKGCNRMVKVPKPASNRTEGTLTDAELFDIVVCQVDHRIVCEPWSKKKSSGRGQGRGGRRLLNDTATDAQDEEAESSPCKTTKWVKPVARCDDFDSAVWNAGATCIANLANDDKHPQCSGKLKPATLDKVKKCKRATEQDAKLCEPMAVALAEYY